MHCFGFQVKFIFIAKVLLVQVQVILSFSEVGLFGSTFNNKDGSIFLS